MEIENNLLNKIRHRINSNKINYKNTISLETYQSFNKKKRKANLFSEDLISQNNNNKNNNEISNKRKLSNVEEILNENKNNLKASFPQRLFSAQNIKSVKIKLSSKENNNHKCLQNLNQVNSENKEKIETVDDENKFNIEDIQENFYISSKFEKNTNIENLINDNSRKIECKLINLIN